jgi:hypothetical protein
MQRNNSCHPIDIDFVQVLLDLLAILSRCAPLQISHITRVLVFFSFSFSLPDFILYLSRISISCPLVLFVPSFPQSLPQQILQSYPRKV